MSQRLNAIMLLVIASTLACTANRRRTPDDTLVMVIESAMTTPDPRYALTNYDGKLARLVAPGLVSVDTVSTEPRLELASAIDRIDDVTIDVTIRPDATFADGLPVRGIDVARTYTSVMTEACGSLYA